MNVLSDFVAMVLRGLIKLALAVLAAVFMLSLLSIALAAVLATIVWSLLTGRKPAVFTTVSRFHQASRQFRQGIWPGNGPRSPQTNADVVDVQVREVREALGQSDRPL